MWVKKARQRREKLCQTGCMIVGHRTTAVPAAVSKGKATHARMHSPVPLLCKTLMGVLCDRSCQVSGDCMICVCNWSIPDRVETCGIFTEFSYHYLKLPLQRRVCPL